MFYDFETTQETGVHTVNWVDCQDFEGNIYNFETVEEFCQFVFDEKHVGYTFIAHNAKAYDAQFILKYCAENQIKPYCIFNGTKIMIMQIEQFKIKFIDSINFVQSALSAFPKTFGFKELKKGYFPHYFNKTCNRDYVGPMPSKKHYGYMYNQMSKQKREDFFKWYKARENEGYVFNLS